MPRNTSINGYTVYLYPLLKARYCDCMSSVYPSVCLACNVNWWIRITQVKIEEKLLSRAYTRNSPMLFRTLPFPTPYSCLFPKTGGLQSLSKTSIDIISGAGKAIRTSNFVRTRTRLCWFLTVQKLIAELYVSVMWHYRTGSF